MEKLLLLRAASAVAFFRARECYLLSSLTLRARESWARSPAFRAIGGLPPAEEPATRLPALEQGTVDGKCYCMSPRPGATISFIGALVLFSGLFRFCYEFAAAAAAG